MFDNYYTKYENAKDYINEKNAARVADSLEVDISLHNMNAEKWAYLSKAYLYLREDKKSVNAAKSAIKLDKNYAYGYVRLAFAYGRLGKQKESLKNVLKAEALGGDDWFIQSFLVVIFSWLGEEEKANFYLDYLLSRNLDTPEYYYAAGFALSGPKEIGRYEEGLEYFKKAEDYKNHYELIYKMMLAYGKINDKENALLYLNKCIAYGETEELLERKIQLYLYRDEPDEILPDMRKFYRMTKDKQQALIYLSRAYDIKCEYCRSLKYLRFAEKTTQPTQYLYERMVNIYQGLKDYRNAISACKKVLKFDKTDEDTILSISFFYSKLKEHELADLYADMVVLLNPERAYPYYRKGNICCDLGEYEQAAEMYKKALELEPNDVDYYGSVSYAYSKSKNYELSLEYANRGIMVDGTDSYIHFRKGWALQELGKYQDAISSFEKCVEFNNKYVDGYANISYCYSKMGDMKKSALYANKAIMVNKDYAYAHYRKAWSLQYQGKFEDAKESFENALKLDPSDSFSYLGLSAVNINLHDAPDALKAATMAIFLDRNCAEAYYFKGLALSNLGKAREAEKYYTMAQKLGYT